MNNINLPLIKRQQELAVKKPGRPKGSRDKERVLDLYREQNKEYLYLGLSLSSIRTILNPQLEIPISYPSYRYLVRQNAKLLKLWQTKKGKGWISTVYLRTKMGDTQITISQQLIQISSATKWDQFLDAFPAHRKLLRKPDYLGSGTNACDYHPLSGPLFC